MSTPNLLLVDDDSWLLESMADWLSEQGFSVTTAQTIGQAKAACADREPQVCLVDINLDREDGFDFLKWSKSTSINAPVLMMSGYASPDTGAQAVSAGAFDLLTKPIIDQELLNALQRAVEQTNVAEENKRLKQELDRRSGMENILSHDPRMIELFDIVDSVADTKATILITGENGTGKSMIARAIHRRSSRRDGPFVEVACGALPENLLESELFGHTAGAFTGANTAKVGKFEHADKGTIFLDEIGTATSAMQVKLLRVLQEFQFEAIGGNETISVDSRCVLATNENLEEAVAAGKFRQDLYYRINVIHLELPPLRQRVSDIPVLAEHFLQKSLQDVPKSVEGFSNEALEALMNYGWPGNIRELENLVQRAVLLTKTPVIGVDMLPPAVVAGGGLSTASVATIRRGQTLREALEGPERQIILDVLKANSFSRNMTADQLGINRTTLYKKMKRLGIDDLLLND